MRSTWTLLIAVAALATVAAPASAVTVPATGVTKAGVGVVDATWHVGASAGQYASDPQVEDSFDPSKHQSRRAASYGVQSRLTVRALVVEGPDGKQVAMVKNDLYLPQDLLWRRTAQILEAGSSGITRDELTITATHDHSSPYYSSTAPGVWTFQDVYDVRFFNYYAKQMAAAVEKAASTMKPVRIGAAVSSFDKTHRHSFGPAIGDDGSPAGYPNSDAEHDLTVVRFDDISDPAKPKRLANLVNFSLHPEMLDGNDLISADYVAPMERMTDRETGAVTIYNQNAVGTAEPERSTYHSVHERLEFTHKEYAQAEYAARLMADAIKTTADGVATGAGVFKRVPFIEGAKVDSNDRWYPGPVSHPFPTVSNCNLERPANPRVGTAPDCQSPFEYLGAPPLPPALAAGPQVTVEQLRAAGIPIPRSFSTPSYGALQEDMSVHLQAIRLGDILFTACSCEQWKDQSENIKARTDKVEGNAAGGAALGYDWTARCDPADGGTYVCPDPRNEAQTLTISAATRDKVRAQVRNDATGWDFVENASTAESEPTDPAQIKGNYSHEELAPANGFALTVPIAMANDYNGYIATYREFRRGDHYRKALTAWGPHSSDYLATRLVELGGHLKQPGGDVLPFEAKRREADAFGGGAAQVQADLAANDARAAGLGDVGEQSITAYEATLPRDGGDAGPVTQPPAAIERFADADFTWNGGNNFVDNPVVVVERKVGDAWEPWADQSGELPVTLKFPKGTDVASYATGGERFEWTAHFEAFVARFDVGRPQRATPEGTYRFVARGKRREGQPNAETVPYQVTSRDFAVRAWRGITVDDFRLEPDNTMSFAVGPRNRYPDRAGAGAITDEIGPIDYPDSYASTVPFINNQRTAYRDPADPTNPDKLEWYCFECSFRPWLDEGDAAAAVVTVIRSDGTIEDVPATKSGGRWVTTRVLAPGESALVAAGGVTDAFADLNGAASPVVSRAADPVDPGPGPAPGTGTGTTPGGSPASGAKPGSAGGSAGTGGTESAQGGSGGAGAPTGLPAGCRDRIAPVSRFVKRGTRATRGGVTLRGASSDRGCARLQRVFVSIAREVAGRRCRYLQADGSFSAPRSCLRTSYLPAKGTRSWRLRTHGRLPRGAYKLWVRGVDSANNVEGKRRGRNFARVRVR